MRISGFVMWQFWGRGDESRHKKILYLGVGQRTGECLQFWWRPGRGRATTYVHEKILYLAVGQRTGERLQI